MEKEIVIKFYKGRFNCGIGKCPESFKTVGGLKIHQRSKHRGVGVRCSFCNLRCEDEEKLDDHTDTFHSAEEPLMCKKCGKVSKDVQALWRHVRESHRSSHFPCTLCGAKFTRPENLKTHVAQLHENLGAIKSVSCLECGKKFRRRTDMRKHVISIHRDFGIRYNCNKCPNTYRDDSALKRHIRWVHNLTFDFSCTDCKVKFKSKAHLERHCESKAHLKVKRKGRRGRKAKKVASEDEEIESEDEDFQVKVEKETEEKKEEAEAEGEGSSEGKVQEKAKRGKKTVKVIIKEEAESSEESESTSSEDETERVKVGESSSEENVQEKGGKTVEVKVKEEPESSKESESSSEEGDEIKVKVDPDDPDPDLPQVKIDPDIFSSSSSDEEGDPADRGGQFYCIYCFLPFPSKEDVAEHEGPCGLLMKGRKTVTCPICGVERKNPHTLKTHMIVHKEEKPWACKLCPAKYKRPMTLTTHVKTVHQGQPTYWQKYKETDRSAPCLVEGCGKVLAGPKNLRRHMWEVHGTRERFQCPHCPKTFKRQRSRGYADHLLGHEVGRRFPCTLCKKAYVTEKKLREHLVRRRHLYYEALAREDPAGIARYKRRPQKKRARGPRGRGRKAPPSPGDEDDSESSEEEEEEEVVVKEEIILIDDEEDGATK